MAKEREQLVNQQRLHEEQLRHAAEKREKELEEEMRLRAEREAREEIERQMQETERLRQKISEVCHCCYFFSVFPISIVISAR